MQAQLTRELAKPFGQIYGDTETPAYIADTGLPVWMWRKGQRVRFLTADGMNQAENTVRYIARRTEAR